MRRDKFKVWEYKKKIFIGAWCPEDREYTILLILTKKQAIDLLNKLLKEFGIL